MKVIVCIKQVPDTKGGVEFNPDGTLNRAAMLAIMNPDDKAGLEAALRLKDEYNQVMTNWNTLEEKFLERFFPHHKFMEAKTSIAVFAQGTTETLNEAWERYKSMLRKCPNHGFDELTQIHIFRNGLLQQTKLLLDATAGGSLLSLSPADATAIIEKKNCSFGPLRLF